MKFTNPETEFIAKYGKAAGWEAFSFYDLTRQEQGIAKVFQINNLLVVVASSAASTGHQHQHRYTWTEYGRNVAGKA